MALTTASDPNQPVAFCKIEYANLALSDLNKKAYWIFLVLGGLFIIQYWAQFFVSLNAGDPWSHKNYWGADVGTSILLAILVVATPIYFFMAWQHWPSRRSNRK